MQRKKNKNNESKKDKIQNIKGRLREILKRNKQRYVKDLLLEPIVECDPLR